MAMIIGCHYATHGGFSFENQSITIPRLWWNALEMGGNFGVDVFVLISGYFLISDYDLNIEPKKVAKLWCQIFFYSVMLLFVSILIGSTNISFKNIIKAVFPITFSRWWFASTYFVMYLIHPYLNRFLHSLSEREYQAYLLFALLLWSIVPTFTGTSFQANALIEFVLYYSIAGYIKLYGFHHKVSSKTWLLLWMGFSVLTYLSCVLLLEMGMKYDFFSGYSLHFYSRQSILTILRAVCFFMMFATMQIKPNRLINMISSATFGVYLIHDSSEMRQYLWMDVFHNASFQDTLIIIPHSIAVILAVFVVCVLVDLFRKNLIEKSVFKFVDAYIEKGSISFPRILESIKRIAFGKN